MILTPHRFPKAILHIDGDAFFASCEVALRPELKGKPVVTGKERGIASAMSYEAKARGVVRGMRLFEIQKICPDAVILPSDYETYSIFSKRMFDIVRRYTPDVEEYSIDECFADITGLQRPLHMSYEQIAARVKSDLERELGMTFSVGLGPTKVVAKIASKRKKPSGLTIIPGTALVPYLQHLPVEKVWGIGPQTSAYLNKLSVWTAHELAKKDETWVQTRLTRPTWEIWKELRGESVYALNLAEKHDYQSISKTRTFTPPSTNPEFIFSQLSKNIENACIKLRRHGLAAKEASVFLKTQDFRYHGCEIRLPHPISTPIEIIRAAKEEVQKLVRPNTEYRATGVVLSSLVEDKTRQLDLFGSVGKEEARVRVYEGVDDLSVRFGKHTVFLGSSFAAMRQRQFHVRDGVSIGVSEGARGDIAVRKLNVLKGETARKRLEIPMLQPASVIASSASWRSEAI